MRVNAGGAAAAQLAQSTQSSQAPKVPAKEPQASDGKPDPKLASQGHVGTKLHLVG